MEFPVLQNSKELSVGDELVVFKPKPEKEDADDKTGKAAKAKAKGRGASTKAASSSHTAEQPAKRRRGA